MYACVYALPLIISTYALYILVQHCRVCPTF